MIETPIIAANTNPIALKIYQIIGYVEQLSLYVTIYVPELQKKKPQVISRIGMIITHGKYINAMLTRLFIDINVTLSFLYKLG